MITQTDVKMPTSNPNQILPTQIKVTTSTTNNDTVKNIVVPTNAGKDYFKPLDVTQYVAEIAHKGQHLGGLSVGLKDGQYPVNVTWDKEGFSKNVGQIGQMWTKSWNNFIDADQWKDMGMDILDTIVTDLFSDNASVLSPHDIAKKYENRRANFESTYLNGNDYNIENNTNIATSTIKRDIQLATTVTIMPTIKTVVQGEPVVSITNENVENDIIENTSTEIIDGEDLAFNLDALSISDSSHITNLKRAVSVFTDNLKQNIDDVKSEQYVSDPDLGESDGDELLRKDGQIWAPGKLNGFVQKKLSTLKSVSPSITTEGNENANYITVAEYRRPPYETIERLIKLDPDFLKHRFDAYFLWGDPRTNDFEDLFSKINTDKEFAHLTPYEKAVLSKEAFAVRFCNINIPLTKNKEFVLKFEQTEIRKVSTTKEKRKKAKFSLRLDNSLVFADQFQAMAGRNVTVDHNFMNAFDTNRRNGIDITSPWKRAAFVKEEFRTMQYDWKDALKVVSRSFAPNSSIRDARLNLVIKHRPLHREDLHRWDSFQVFVFENVRILGLSDNIKFSRESTDVQNMNVDFTYKKMYVFNSDNFSLEK
jgi:hypothetical protein